MSYQQVAENDPIVILHYEVSAYEVAYSNTSLVTGAKDIFAKLNSKILGLDDAPSIPARSTALSLSPLLSMCSPSTITDMIRKRALNIEASIGRVQFHETEEAIANLLNFHPEQALSHYLRYLNCLHHREFPGALDSLHRYFDYAMVEKWGKNFVQYAIINLASLHHSFGHRELSLLATDEAVRVAQQNGDGGKEKLVTCKAV